MNILIIGAGNVGSALARGLTRAGHAVTAVDDEPARMRTLAGSADVVILAVPFAAHDAVAAALGSSVDGKPVVDVSNALSPDFTLALGFTTSAAEEMQRRLPGARIVKALNTTFAGTMDSGHVKGERLTAFVAGDEPEAKAIAQGLARDLGFDAVDAGPLASARLLEPMGFLNIQLGYALGLGTEIGLRLVR